MLRLAHSCVYRAQASQSTMLSLLGVHRSIERQQKRLQSRGDLCSSRPQSSSSSWASTSSDSTEQSDLFTEKTHRLASDHGIAFHSKKRPKSSSGSSSDHTHPAGENRPASGEDAFYLSQQNDAFLSAGVFDGVGGWADQGVDPSKASWLLSKQAEALCRQSKDHNEYESPGNILEQAAHEIDERAIKERILGSTTACMASVSLVHKWMKLANLGDSGACIIRDRKIQYMSKFQTWSFNAPFQLGIPYSVLKKYGATHHPQDADISTHTIEPNDCIILATDGLWDNVSLTECLQLCVGDAQSAATKLCDAAVKAGNSEKDGPFAEYARKNGYNFSGGKEDDVCVIVIKIFDPSNLASAKL